MVKQCKKSWSKHGISDSTISKYTQHFIDVFTFMVNNHKQLSDGVKRQLCKRWINDFKQHIITSQSPWSAWNSTCIMSYVGVGREVIETLNNLAIKKYGFRLFDTRSKIDRVWANWNPMVDKFMQLTLAPTEDNKKKKKSKLFHNMVYYFSIFLALAMNLDGYINGNRFEPHELLCGPHGDYLPAVMGSDKCDCDGIGLYAFGVGINCPGSSSSLDSTISLFLYGSWKDDYRSMNEIYDKTGYKLEFEAVQRLPVVVSVVKYAYKDSDIFECENKNNNNNNNHSNDICMITNNNNFDNNHNNNNSTPNNNNNNNNHSNNNDICMITTNNSNHNNNNNDNNDTDIPTVINNNILSRLSVSCVLAYNPDHHIKLNNKRKLNATVLRDEWNHNNPIKTFRSNDGDYDTEQLKSWQYRSNKSKRLGMDIFTNKKTKKPRQSYNWQTALHNFKHFLNGYTPDSDLLVCQAYFEDSNKNNNNDITGVITNMCKRSMEVKATNKILPFVEKYQFTNGM